MISRARLRRRLASSDARDAIGESARRADAATTHGRQRVVLRLREHLARDERRDRPTRRRCTSSSLGPAGESIATAPAT